MLITGVLGYIFKMLCISVGMTVFTGNAPLKSYLTAFYINTLFLWGVVHEVCMRGSGGAWGGRSK